DGNAFEQDVYLLKFIVTDSAGHETGYSSKTIDPFLVAVDDGAPTLEIKTESGVFYAGDVSVKGKMDDTSAKLYRYTSADCTQGEQPITVKEDKSWEDTIKIKERQDSYIYWYKAIDSYNQETIKEFSFKYDPTEPRFSITEIQSTDVNYGIAKNDGEYANYFAEENPTAKVQKFGNLTDSFTVKGTVQDDWKDGSTEENTSGIGSYFYYYVGNLTETNKYNINSDGWKTCAITKRDGENPSWEAPISFEKLKNGDTVNIYFAAVDKAGNVSVIKDNPSAVLTVKIDIDKPVVKDPVLDLDNSTIKVLALDNESDIDTEAITSTRNGDKINLSVLSIKDETISEVVGGSQTQKTYKSFLFSITNNDLVVGDNKFIFSVKDKAGNAKETEEIIINNKAPEFSEENTGIPESAYRVKDCSYVKAPFTTTANVACTGNNKLSKVYYSDTYETKDSDDKKVVNTIVKDIPVSVLDGKFTIPAPTPTLENIADYKQKYENKTVTRTVTAENIYGQKATWEYKFNADLTAPIEKNEAKIKIDGNVNDWFNKTTLPISGTYTENGSGVKQVTYKLTNGSGTVVESAGSIYTTKTGSDENFAANIGGFTEGKNPNTLDFIATDNAGNESGNTQLINIKIDTTTPKLLATVAPDEAENTTSNIVWYRFDGETEWKKLENSILTNKTKDVELTGAFEDINEGNLQSGVREIKINVNNNQINAKVYTKSEGENATWSVPSDPKTGFEPNDVNNSIQSGRWFATIPAASLSNSDCTAEIKIKDNAGNEGNPEKVNFRVDITAPVVTIEMPSANSTLNGLNTFSGKVNDANDVKSIKLYYAFAETDTAPTTFKEYKPLATNVQADTKTLLEKVVGENSVSLSDVTSWKFEEVDVNKILPSETVKGNLFILPVAYDKAGNNNISGTAELEEETSVSGKATKFIIDLHSDRPIIKFTNLSWKDGTYEKYLNATTLNASIEDDDGIKEVKVAIAEGEDVTTRPDWNTQTVTSSSIKIELEDDGPKTIWLYVKDAAGGEFETSSTKITVENASQPYLLFDGNETKQ
ncbi:MAG: Ig-like domain repeat protein, partial [Treponema sp.]|nr:Ig-like domain repeat protein [Treponema sp.]